MIKIKTLHKYYDPLNTYRIFKDSKASVFLDSSKEDSPYSNYSFIGVNPIWEFKSYKDVSYLNGEEIKGKDSFKFLEELMNEYRCTEASDIPFIGGAIGYFSYDMGRNLEVLPDTSMEDFKMYDSYFVLYENIIIFDLKKKITYISAIDKDRDADKSIKKIEGKLNSYINVGKISFEENKTEFESNFTKEDYEEAIRKLKDYIRSGDVYIANLTRRIMCENSEDSFYIYEKLRSINEAPFSVYMNYEDFQVISSSPERFLSIVDGVVTTTPIKGTRPRGKTESDDLVNKKELETSEKDKSELLMIVDLERNDLSKVCKENSVKVKDLFKIEEYATVFHLVSTIEGRLRENVSSIECMKKCFPGGSITGAPKIRSMEIIEELEAQKRNLYTGAIGYFDVRGNADFNIVIRTIIKRGNKAYFGVGGGITYESIEEDEWYETCHKAEALMRVL